MKCPTPKILYLRIDPRTGQLERKMHTIFWDGKEEEVFPLPFTGALQPQRIYRIFAPCRSPNCYACSNTMRAEWAFRCKQELKDPKNLSYHFITLTYDDKYLPTQYDLYDTTDEIPEVENYKKLQFEKLQQHRSLHLSLIKHLPKSKRNYGYVCVLRPSDITDFIANVQKYLSDNFFQHLKNNYKNYYIKGSLMLEGNTVIDTTTGEVIEEGYIKQRGDGFKLHRSRIKSDIPHLCRFYITGEYGTFTHRSHYHGLLFFPVKLSVNDVLLMLKKCWRKGNVDVAYTFASNAINYVAKHQVKTDKGTFVQQNLSPIFKRISRYNGGLGYIARQDESLRARYFYEDENGENPYRYIENGDYKLSFPYYLSRSYQPDNKTEAQLASCEEQSNIRIDEYIAEVSYQHPFVLDASDKREQFLRCYLVRKEEDLIKRKEYEKQYYLQKVAKKKNQGYCKEDLNQ